MSVPLIIFDFLVFTGLVVLFAPLLGFAVVVDLLLLTTVFELAFFALTVLLFDLAFTLVFVLALVLVLDLVAVFVVMIFPVQKC